MLFVLFILKIVQYAINHFITDIKKEKHVLENATQMLLLNSDHIRMVVEK